MAFRYPFSLLLTSLILVTLAARTEEPSGGKSDESKLRINLSTDLVSRYIWRGTDFGNSPSIQPTLSLAGSNFEAGCWSAFATNNSYKEIDLYLKYSFRNFSITITDYYVPEINGLPASPDPGFFVFADKTTAHTVEASLHRNYGISDNKNHRKLFITSERFADTQPTGI